MYEIKNVLILMLTGQFADEPTRDQSS